MRIITSLIIFGALLLLPELTLAQDVMAPNTGFVPCSGTECSACHFIIMANTIIVWLIGVMFVIFGIIAVVAGFGLVTSGGNVSAKEDAKSKFLNAFIGLLIVLAAWLLVDTLMRTLLADGGNIQGYGPWAEITCGTQADTYVDSANAGTDGTTPPTVMTPSGPVSVTSSGSTCFNGPDGAVGGGDDVCVATSNVSGGAYNLPDGSSLGYAAPEYYIGPDQIAANPQIAPNLRLCDVTNCDAARRSGDYVYIDPFMVAQLNEVYNDLGGLSVNSGYRSPAYNQSVGGATHSRHQYGDAVDIAVTPSNTESAIMASCRARGATNIYTYASGRHVHCDWRGAPRQ